MSKLDNEVCLVTGATRGIGKAIAISLARAGGKVIGTATSDEGASAIDGYFRECGFEGRGVVLNVVDSDAVSTLVREISAEHGAPTVLVNNAGITRDNCLSRKQSLPERHDQSQTGQDRQHYLGGGGVGQPGPEQLCSRQSGHDRIYQITGRRGRHTGRNG